MFEFVIPRRPLSHQTKNRANLQAWKEYVSGLAAQYWAKPCMSDEIELRLTLVYICDDFPADIDNIIKPIQDAMVGVVYDDDIQISDVDSHRRYLTDPIVVTGLPQLLADAIEVGAEAVYVKVSNSGILDEYI